MRWSNITVITRSVFNSNLILLNPSVYFAVQGFLLNFSITFKSVIFSQFPCPLTSSHLRGGENLPSRQAAILAGAAHAIMANKTQSLSELWVWVQSMIESPGRWTLWAYSPNQPSNRYVCICVGLCVGMWPWVWVWHKLYTVEMSSWLVGSSKVIHNTQVNIESKVRMSSEARGSRCRIATQPFFHRATWRNISSNLIIFRSIIVACLP